MGNLGTSLVRNNNRLLGNIMAGLFLTGKNIDREKYGGFSENPQHFTGHEILEGLNIY